MCDYLHAFDIIWENDSFFIAFDNYQLSYNHILVVPKTHILASIKYDGDDLLEILNRIVTFYKQQDFLSVLYEHGNRAENHTANLSVDHAHIHIIGIKNIFINTQDLLPKYDSVYSTINEFYSQRIIPPYHMLSINGQATFVSTDNLPSQIFRHNIADLLKEFYWNWKQHGEIIKRNIENNKVTRSNFKRKLNKFLNNF